MSIASLIASPPLDDSAAQAAWAFELAMAHRTLLGAMAPLDRFSAIPYFLDPMQDVHIPAGDWNTNRQQAQNDAATTLPSYYGAATRGFAAPEILIDTDLTDPASLPWWSFQNHQFLYVATATIQPGYPSQYPFW